MYLTVILPSFNEAGNLGGVIGELETRIKENPEVRDYEIILVDDHSSDDTFLRIKGLSNPKVSILRLSRRSGSHTALRAGIAVAKGDAALCISADGQDDPRVLGEMLGKWKEGKQVVWAVRKKRKEPLFSRLTTFVFYKALNRFNRSELGSDLIARADFYLLDRRALEAVKSCQERNTSLFGLILWLGFRQDYVLYDRRERMMGRSKWNFTGRMRLAKDWIMAFSGVPLRFITYFGLATACLGFLYAIFIFVYALSGYATPGWAESTIWVLIVNGVQMTMLGIIGEYLWRAFDETKRRPLYFVEEEHQPESKP